MASRCGARILLLALCWWQAVAFAAEPASLKIDVLLFSGRPDPSFTITDGALIRQIVSVFEALPTHPTLTDKDSALPPQLGYRGFRVTPTGMSGITSFDVYGTAVEVISVPASGGAPIKSFRFDTNAALEQLLFQIARAQGAVPNDGPPTTITAEVGTTVADRSVTINLGAPIITVVALPARAPVTVLVGTRVKLVATVATDAATAVSWVKDSRAVPTAGRTFEFVASSRADSGRYWAIASLGNGQSTTSDSVDLLVTTREGQRLLNTSVLGRISAEQPVLTSGFVIEPGFSGSGTLMLVRAVGPGLIPLGVAGALRAPQLRLADARGTDVAPTNIPFLFPTVAAATERTGAFVLPANSLDIARLYYLPAGAFTAQVSSAEAGTGVVLLELFEVPLDR